MTDKLQFMASKRSDISSFLAMDVLSRANAAEAAGRKILHMEVGEPAGGTPIEAIDAAKRAMDAGQQLGYLEARGLPALRERIARLYDDWYGVTLDPGRIAICAGASAGFVLSFLSAFDSGQRVALADPGYPCYRNTLEALGLEPVRIATSIEDGFQPTIAQLEQIQEPLHGLIIASPANPTGSLIGRERLADLVKYCEQREIKLISDEIYHGLTYGEPATTVLAETEHAIVVNSFSKFFRMTGWRIGWVVLPNALIRNVEKLGQNLYISASALGQHAALGVFDAEARLAKEFHIYRRNREVLLNSLIEGGVTKIAPADGGFYVYADVGHLTNDSVAFCQRALDEIGVAFAPGLDFDPERGHQFVRFSFAAEPATVEEASARLAIWLKDQTAKAAA